MLWRYLTLGLEALAAVAMSLAAALMFVAYRIVKKARRGD